MPSKKNKADTPIDIHTLQLQDWLVSHHLCVSKNINAPLKDIRAKIANALQDMPSHEKIIKLLSGTKINYYHCKEIVEILKQTEKDTKSVFATYGSQRIKDWQEVVRMYEYGNIYLAETAQLYVRNVMFEIPNVRKQMVKRSQQGEESFKRIGDLAKPEAQLLAEHAALLRKWGVKGENLREEFTEVLQKLPELYTRSIQNIGVIQAAIDLYAECNGQNTCLPILRHLITFGNTTVYQYINKEVPLVVKEPPIKLNLSADNDNMPHANVVAANLASADIEIDFGVDYNGGTTSSTVSAEIIDFGDFNLEGGDTSCDMPESVADAGDINWGVESPPTDAEEINFDIPIEEYGIVVEGIGMDGGTAKGEQAYTLLDSPNYRDRLLDELYELQSFLRMRLFELGQLEMSNNVMFSMLENLSTQDAESIRKMLIYVEAILHDICSEHTRHLFQLKHSPKYADLLAAKLKQMSKAVEKIRLTKETLKQRFCELRQQRLDLNPMLAELTAQTKELQLRIENDISRRYKKRIVNLLGGVD